MSPRGPAAIELPAASRRSLYRRSLVVVAVSQVFGGAGLAAGVTFGALLAQDLLGSAALAGVPAALFTLGSALTALLVGRLSQHRGRRVGLTAGFLAGAVGATGIVVAAALRSPVLLFAALVVYGAGTATNLQARYAGTDLAPPTRRATAVSIVLVSTTVGAVAGPNLVGPTGRVAAGLGLPVLTGPFLLAAAAYLVAASVLACFLRPDPSLVRIALDLDEEPSPTAEVEPADGPGAWPRGLVLGAAVMVLSTAAMAAIMTMTPIHMREHGHSLTAVGFVIGVHIGAMYLPSLLTGWLVDVVGRLPMAVAAAVVLLAAGLVSALSPGGSMVGPTLALALLGLGWNIGLISGTALVVDATPVGRARTQGTLDVFVALSGAAGGVLSGLVVVGAGYPALSLGGGLLALALLPLVVWARRAGAAAR